MNKEYIVLPLHIKSEIFLLSNFEFVLFLRLLFLLPISQLRN